MLENKLSSFLEIDMLALIRCIPFICIPMAQTNESSLEINYQRYITRLFSSSFSPCVKMKYKYDMYLRVKMYVVSIKDM